MVRYTTLPILLKSICCNWLEYSDVRRMGKKKKTLKYVNSSWMQKTQSQRQNQTGFVLGDLPFCNLSTRHCDKLARSSNLSILATEYQLTELGRSLPQAMHSSPNNSRHQLAISEKLLHAIHTRTAFAEFWSTYAPTRTVKIKNERHGNAKIELKISHRILHWASRVQK